MKIRTLIILLAAIFLLSAPFASAISIPVRANSNYGSGESAGLFQDGNLAPAVVDGFAIMLVCPQSVGCATGGGFGDDFLAIITPTLAPGTIVTISGAGITQLPGLYCSGSFIGGCTIINPDQSLMDAPLTPDQMSCLNSLSANASFSGNTFQFSVPSCSLATANGDNMEFIFADGFTELPQVDISTQAAVTTPEPNSLFLLGLGLAALCFARKLRAAHV